MFSYKSLSYIEIHSIQFNQRITETIKKIFLVICLILIKIKKKILLRTQHTKIIERERY